MARAAAESEDAERRAFAAAWADDRRSAVERARDAIFGEIAAIEATQERVALAARSVVAGERSARTLLLLARALSEIDRLERARDKEAAGRARARPAEARPVRGETRGRETDELEGDELEAARAALVRRLEVLFAEEGADEAAGLGAA